MIKVRKLVSANKTEKRGTSLDRVGVDTDDEADGITELAENGRWSGTDPHGLVPVSTSDETPLSATPNTLGLSAPIGTMQNVSAEFVSKMMTYR